MKVIMPPIATGVTVAWSVPLSVGMGHRIGSPVRSHAAYRISHIAKLLWHLLHFGELETIENVNIIIAFHRKRQSTFCTDSRKIGVLAAANKNCAICVCYWGYRFESENCSVARFVTSFGVITQSSGTSRHSHRASNHWPR